MSIPNYDPWALASPPEGPPPAAWCVELSDGRDDWEVYAVYQDDRFLEVMDYNDLHFYYPSREWETLKEPPALDEKAQAAVERDYPGYTVTGNVADLWRDE